MRLYAIEEQTEKCGDCIGQATVFIVGWQGGSSTVAVRMFVQSQCVVGLRNVATPRQQTLFGEVFKDRSTLDSPVVTICNTRCHI